MIAATTQPSRIPCAIVLMMALMSLAQPNQTSGSLVHRWSFNAPNGSAAAGIVLNDSVSALPITVRGTGALFNEGNLVLPGNTGADQPEATISACIDMPNGMVSTRTDVTLEFWATPLGGRNWAPLFDFGRMNVAGDGLGAPGEWTGASPNAPPGGTQSEDAFGLLLSRGDDLNLQRLGTTLNGTREDFDSSLPTIAGQPHHYVVTVTDGAGVNGASGMQLAWYRDGVEVGSMDVAHHLSDIEDVNCWLGRLQWTGLGVANVAYDEFRFHDHAFTAGEVTASLALGPDITLGPPVLQPDEATMHHGQKIRLTVLENDSPGVTPASVTVVTPPQFGTATADAEGRILYHHTTGTPLADTFTYEAAGSGGTSTPVVGTLNFSTSLRIANTTLDIPNQPPMTHIELVPAYGTLTFQQPVVVASPPGETQRLFVVERQRGLQLIPNTGAEPPISQMFFNLATYLTGRGEMLGDTFDQGVFGMAFHPGYATNRHFFLFYSARVAGTDYFRVSRFSTQAANSNAVDQASELVLLQQVDANGYHLGTDLHFGPDGYLYISTGDGGGQNDSRGNGQLIDRDFFCAILRIDVDKRPGNREPNAHPSVPLDGGLARYSVPADNPYVTDDPTVTYNGGTLPASSVRTEFWANGLRNPWKFSFDSVTGELWCGDVGQNAREEINLITRGGNYGWAYREGTLNGPRVGEQPAGFSSIAPIYEYGQGNGEFQGFSISGGLVHRGTSVAPLIGAYVFADYVSGNIWALRRPEGTTTVERVAGEAGITSFGVDPATGDLLAVDHGDSRILRFTEGEEEQGNFPTTLSATGLFADLTDLSPAPGLLPYTPNLTFWSDHAIKRRWFMIPDATNRFTWARDQPWNFPAGALWVKHFDLELELGNPATARRIETRLLVKNETGSYGVSYRWNEAQTEATLVDDEGDSFVINILDNGMSRPQTYRIPSRAECLVCHTPQAGHVLSFNTRQLNQTASIHHFTGNQLTLLNDGGFFGNTPTSPNLLPRHFRAAETNVPIEARVRSYLDVNCANCHRTGGTATPSWDGRAVLTLEETGLIDGAALNNGGDPANRLVVPGDLARSIVLNRVAATNGFTPMPAIGSNVLDQEAIALLTDWITQSLPTLQNYEAWRLTTFGSSTSPEGAPSINPDGDFDTNHGEFLGGTDPLDPDSFITPTIATEDSSVTLSITLPDHRWYRVETSTNLLNWSPWDVPGNGGHPVSEGSHRLTGPTLVPHQFFRFVIGEN